MEIKIEDCKYIEEAIEHGRMICCVCGKEATSMNTTHKFYTDGTIVVDAESKLLLDTISSGVQEVFIGKICLENLCSH